MSEQKPQDAEKPTPDLAEVPYGPHERNVLDLWKARSKAPAPLVVHIHGGGFRGGSKANLPASLLRQCLAAGISVAAINYRLSLLATFPAAMLDGARAVEFLRFHAKEWNLDGSRVAATGGSAGGGISLWLGFHDDLADAASADPVARQSTRLTCMAVMNTQSSYDLRFIKEVIGGPAHQHPALLEFYGLKADEVDTPRAHEMFEAASSINYVSAGDPPVFMWYTQPNKPLTADSTANQAIHHPKFGQVLKAKLDALGIECIIRYGDDYEGETVEERRPRADQDIVKFFLRHFGRAR